MSWIDFLDKSAKDFPHKVALIDQATKRRLTYTSLKNEVDNWAAYLESVDVDKGDRIAFIHTNCLEHLTLFLACARLGAVFVPINWRLGNVEKEEIFAKTTPRLILTKGQCKLDMASYNHQDIEKITLPERKKKKYPEIEMHAPLLMLFTSGSTGSPKGVLLHGEMLQANQRETCKSWKLLESDRTIIETPFFHTGGYNVLCLPLWSIGGTVVLAKKFDRDNLFNTIEEEKITVYFGVPTMFQCLSEHARFESTDFSSIRFLISGGAHCSVEIIKKFQQKSLVFKQGFGLTEVGPNCFLLEESEAVRKAGSIGRPMAHSKVLLVKEEGIVASKGEVGELLIGGPHVCKGYFEEEERFKKSMFDGYFKTGDLAKQDKDGYFHIVGRKKEMYISGGENVYPVEVEKKLVTHPTILDAVVVPVPCDKWGEVGLAYLRCREDLELKDLRLFLDPLLSRYKHPHFIKRVHDYPLLSNGKIDRLSLSKHAGIWKTTGVWK